MHLQLCTAPWLSPLRGTLRAQHGWHGSLPAEPWLRTPAVGPSVAQPAHPPCPQDMRATLAPGPHSSSTAAATLEVTRDGDRFGWTFRITGIKDMTMVGHELSVAAGGVAGGTALAEWLACSGGDLP